MFKCPICGYECQGCPEKCPVCGMPGSGFIEQDDRKVKDENVKNEEKQKNRK